MFLRVSLICVSALLLFGCDFPTKNSEDHYRIAVDQGGNAWLVDTAAGQTFRCWQGTPGTVPPRCYAAIRDK